MRHPRLEAVQPDEPQQLDDAPAALGAARQAEGDVAGDVEVGEERVILEDHADAPPLRRQAEAGTGDGLAGDLDRAGVGRLEAGDQAQHRRLAAAARPKQRQQLSPRQRQVDAVDGPDLAEALDDAGAAEIGSG